ncbi:MAG: enoyl-CoA hydratase [Thermomicrobiales bacterium]
MAQTAIQAIATVREGSMLIVTFNRPEVLNAFNDEMIAGLQDAIRQAERDAAVRCVVLTGAGRGFCAGQDLGVFKAREAAGAGEGMVREHLRAGYNQIVLRMRGLEKPIVASINGIAAGVGLSLALAADLRIAADNALFTLGFSKIGLIPDGGASFMLPLLVGLGRASELAFTSDRVDAQEAHRLGLINRVVPAADLPEATLALARDLAAMPTRALGLTKRAFNHAILPDLAAWLDYEAHIQETASRTQDHREGVAAFLEKRPATFRGE